VSTQPPIASVILRTYDHAPFIAQAIESVLLQRARFPFELIVAEDCSTDGTRAVVEGYAQRHPQTIRAILPERNLGHGEMFKRALAEVRGRYVAYLDGDDYWTSPTKLAQQVDFLESCPDCRSCFHDVSLVYDVAGLPSGDVSPRLAETRFGLDQILMDCFVPAPAVVFRREVGEELGDWVFSYAWIDWLIHVQAARSGSIGYLPRTLAAYRVHRGGMFSALDRVSQLEEEMRFYERLLGELPQQRDRIERCVLNRHAQLAIERLGVSYDSCVVLVDPGHELRPYFNGRHARHLPRREGHEITELEAIRAAVADLPPAVGDYGPRVDRDAHGSACYVVLPSDAAGWLRRRPELSDYLVEHARVAWESEWTTVFELGTSSERRASARWRATRRAQVEMLLPPSGDTAAFLDLPSQRASLPAHAIVVVGWALAHGGAAEAIEFEHDGELVWRAPVSVSRPDVAEALAGAPDRCGFQTTLNAQELPPGAAVDLFAVFAGGVRVRLAELRLLASAEHEREEPARGEYAGARRGGGEAEDGGGA
jgi:glycosyltransferase involved in cell wall biosynthesis